MLLPNIVMFGVLALSVVASVPSYAEPATRATYFFILDCHVPADYVQALLKWYMPAYRAALADQDIQVTCLYGADLATLDKVTVPLLRQVFPNDLFVFIYDEADKDEFKQLVGRNGHGVGSANGYAILEEGYALSIADQYLMQHELTHIVSCKYHNREADPLDKWYYPREAQGSPFCA